MEKAEGSSENCCNICEKHFPNIDDHVRKRHGSKNHTCEICHKAFLYKTSMERHKTETHTDDIRSYECDVCNKVLYSKLAMKRHTRSHSISKFMCKFATKYFLIKAN